VHLRVAAQLDLFYVHVADHLPVDHQLAHVFDVAYQLPRRADDEVPGGVERALEDAVDAQQAVERQLALELDRLADGGLRLVVEDAPLFVLGVLVVVVRPVVRRVVVAIVTLAVVRRRRFLRRRLERQRERVDGSALRASGGG